MQSKGFPAVQISSQPLINKINQKMDLIVQDFCNLGSFTHQQLQQMIKLIMDEYGSLYDCPPYEPEENPQEDSPFPNNKDQHITMNQELNRIRTILLSVCELNLKLLENIFNIKQANEYLQAKNKQLNQDLITVSQMQISLEDQNHQYEKELADVIDQLNSITKEKQIIQQNCLKLTIQKEEERASHEGEILQLREERRLLMEDMQPQLKLIPFYERQCEGLRNYISQLKNQIKQITTKYQQLQTLNTELKEQSQSFLNNLTPQISNDQSRHCLKGEIMSYEGYLGELTQSFRNTSRISITQPNEGSEEYFTIGSNQQNNDFGKKAIGESERSTNYEIISQDEEMTKERLRRNGAEGQLQEKSLLHVTHDFLRQKIVKQRIKQTISTCAMVNKSL